MEINSLYVDDSEYLTLETLLQIKKEKIEYEVSTIRASVNGIEAYPTYTEYVIDECDETIDLDLLNAIIEKVSKTKFLFRACNQKTEKMIVDKEIKLDSKTK